jgi:DNA-binding transcriptional LysR family regulator
LKDSIQTGDLYAGLSLLRLQVFVAVVDHGGFSAASAHLDLAQPTISFHVKALERLLGAQLLVYRRRRVHLTPAGEELYRVATAMLRDAERLATTVRNVQAGQAGELRLGASIAFELRPFFEDILAPFVRRHPGLRVSVMFGHSVRLAEDVLDNQIDLAYVQNWRFPVGVTYEPIHHAEFVLMVSPTHPLARKPVVEPEDVYEAGLITAPIYSQEWPHYEELLRRSGLTRYRVSMEIDGVQPRLLATHAGLGVMGVFVPPYAAESLGALLRPVRLASTPPRAEFGIVTRQHHIVSTAAAEFVAWLRRVAATGPL